MPQLSRRTETFTDSVIRRMTRVSLKYGAVNLSQGFPDFEPPREILDRLAEVSREDFHQYSITWGAQNFREALAEKQSRLMGRTIDPNSEIVVTCGSTEAMMAAMMTVANPGDKVIVFSPFYENYGADAILSGAEPIYVPLYPPDFGFKADELEAAFRQKPKALILCNPSNPCGKVFTYEELKLIADLAAPYLREHIPQTFSEIPDTTSYEAGYLVSKNAGWRSVRPVIDTDRCVGCLQCYLHCPDGVIFRKDGKVAIDYDFCKGCGICAKICRIKAIETEAERK